MNVLVVEDDEATQLIVGQTLRLRGHDVCICGSAEEAMKEVKRQFYPLVLLDLNLPGMDGISFCRWLRRQEDGDRYYVMVGTASQDHEDMEKVLKGGANDFIKKPYHPAILNVRFTIAEQQVVFLLQRKCLEDALQREKDFISVVLETAGAMILVLSSTLHVMRCNRTCKNISGLGEEMLMGHLFSDVLVGEGQKGDVERMLKTLVGTGGGVSFETDIHSYGGVRKHISWNCTSVVDHESELEYIICTGLDMTEGYEALQRVAFLAEHDPLTRLYNRDKMGKVLQEAIKRAKFGEVSSLVYIDLDNFKMINDTMGGHHSGDKLLVQVAANLMQATRDGDWVFRFGGDEFVVMLPRTGIERAAQIADRIRTDLGDLVFRYEERVANVGASIGITEINGNFSSDQVLAHADAACYTAKSHGRNRVERYEIGGEMFRAMQRDGDWVARIKEAMSLDHFELWFQPIQSMDTQKVKFYETLLRLRSEDGHVIPPSMFLPSAERFHIIRDLDRYVLRKTFEYLCEEGEIRVSINLSGDSLGDQDLPAYVKGLAGEYQIDPCRVILEITETVMISNMAVAIRLVEELRDAGFKFALDDFGQGFSSLSQLKNLPVDMLKIDGSFIQDMGNDQANRVFVRSINEIAHHLEMESVAEYVEDEKTLEILRYIGVDYVQGYLIGKPEPREVVPMI